MKALKIISFMFALIFIISGNIEAMTEKYGLQQEGLIKGKVVDVNGDAIIGATIQVLETKNGVILNSATL